MAIIRVARTDEKNQHILVRTNEAKNQPSLRLIGTEHEHLYHRKIDEPFLKSSQFSKSNSLDDWRHVLYYIFLRRDAPNEDITKGVDATATIDGEVLTITVRRNIGSITQKLGMVTLKQDDEKEEVSAFEWADEAVAAGEELRSRLEKAESGVHEQSDAVKDLERQLDVFVKAKKEHEDELLQKFATLLNAKKLKIRDLQRLLAGAKIDPERAAAVHSSRMSRTNSPKPSRKGKRKASEAAAMDDIDTAMDQDVSTDQASHLDEENHQRRETPQHSDIEASEGEEAIEGTVATTGEKNADELQTMLPSREKEETRSANPPLTRVAASTSAVDDDQETDVETDDEL